MGDLHLPQRLRGGAIVLSPMTCIERKAINSLVGGSCNAFLSLTLRRSD